jgi:hypothetical protein
LSEVFGHARWISQYRVKVALCMNPQTPEDIVATLLSYLQIPHLHYAAGSKLLRPSVRKRAAALLRARGQHPGNGDVPVHRVTEEGMSLQTIDGDDPDIDLEALAAQLANWQATS